MDYKQKVSYLSFIKRLPSYSIPINELYNNSKPLNHQ